MSSSRREYYIILDTNVVYHPYDKGADFSSFSFGSNYDSIINCINELDIYEKVAVVIPSVVWSELQQQIIEAHDKQLGIIRNFVGKYRFPEIEIKEKASEEYQQFITRSIDQYKEQLVSTGINTVMELPMASNSCFCDIIQRAFEKRPPFEGKDKESDKGFKDALLWESILQFASVKQNCSIILFTFDKIFGDVLHDEFSRLYPNSSIVFCHNLNEAKTQLDEWAKEIDIYAYHPLESDETSALIEWLESGDFLAQVIDRDFGLVEKGRLIKYTAMHLLGYDNIQMAEDYFNEMDRYYMIDGVLQIEYKMIDDSIISEILDVRIEVEAIDDSVFTVEDVHVFPDLEEVCDEGENNDG